MKKIINIILNITLAINLSFGINSYFVFAEEFSPIQENTENIQDDNQTQEEVASSEESLLEIEENEVQQATIEPVIQDTVSVQDVLSGDTISDISEDVDIIPIIDDNDDSILPVGDIENSDENIIRDDTGLEDEILSTEEEVEENLNEEIIEEVVEDDFVIEIVKPRPIYTFSLTKRTIPTHRKDTIVEKNLSGKQVSSQRENLVERTVEETIIPDINDEAGTMSLSGACLDKYFVVLLYKDELDYSNNSNSYIYNKAFMCDNGSFDYEISELPESLIDGTYYILIGEQGDIGTWKPSSQLTEININRN